jgi:predicted transcriptional regulator
VFFAGLLKCVGHSFRGFCCCGGTVTLFYEGELRIDADYRGRKMASGIVRVNKLRVNRQVVLMEYGDEAGLKLRKSNGLDFGRGSKRERMEIMAEILCYCKQQKSKTDIMYTVNLNYAQLKKYLKSLTSQGLLVADRNKYATTQKGYRFLKLLAQLNNILVS